MKLEIAFMILVLLWLESSSTALQMGVVDNHGKKGSIIYYTSATRKCTSPRRPVVNPTKADYSIITHLHDDSTYPHPSCCLLAPMLESQNNPHTTTKHAITTSNHNHPKRFQTQSLVNLGCAFALNSGFLNGLCLSGVLGRAMPVAAVTGTYTNAAVASTFARHQEIRHGLGAIVGILATPVCYMLGSMVNGLCNPQGTTPAEDNNDHPLSIMQTASPLLLAGTVVLLAKKLLVMKYDAWATCLCITFAMGLQNSWTSMILPGNLLRTTHFSGITSDFGTILGQMIRGNQANAYKLSPFATLTASFWLGGILSQMAVQPPLGLEPSLCYTMSALFYFAVWGLLQQHYRYSLVLRRAIMTFLPSIQASLHQRCRTAVAFFNFWYKERLGRNQRTLSWHT